MNIKSFRYVKVDYIHRSITFLFVEKEEFETFRPQMVRKYKPALTKQHPFFVLQFNLKRTKQKLKCLSFVTEIRTANFASNNFPLEMINQSLIDYID